MSKKLSVAVLAYLVFELFAPLIYLINKVDYDIVFIIAIWLTLTGFFSTLLPIYFQYHIVRNKHDEEYFALSIVSCVLTALQLAFCFYAFDMDNNLSMVAIIGDTPYSLLFVAATMLIFIISLFQSNYYRQIWIKLKQNKNN